MELRSVPMRIRHVEDPLGSRYDGPIHASHYWVWHPLRHRGRSGARLHVPSGDSRKESAQIPQLGSGSAVSVPPMESQSSSTRCDRDQTVPYVPLSHPFVERLIGTLRREHLDRILFWTTLDLAEKLTEFQHYYNGHRAHA